MADSPSSPQQVSVQEMFRSVGRLFVYVRRKASWVIAFSLVGAAIGVAVAWYTPTTYTAKLDLLVEEGGGGGGGLSAIAGQFGFDLGGLGGGKGLLSGDNIIIYLKSSSLSREVLLSAYDSSSNVSLADVFAQSSGMLAGWEKGVAGAKAIHFPVQGTSSRLQDSLLQVMTESINRKNLVIEKPDKKASFVQVTVLSRDEIFSKLYCERLVDIATKRYVSGKVSVQQTNVSRLQKRADSLSALLFRRTYSAAAAQESVLDINPALKSALVAPEVAGRDKLMATTIYGEVVKNLEISKVALSQETPTVQIVDTPILPLKKNRPRKLFFLLGGGLVSGLLSVTYFLMKAVFSGTADR